MVIQVFRTFYIMLDFAPEEKKGGGGGGRGGGGRGGPGRGRPAPPSKPASGAAALGGLVTGKPPGQVSGPQPSIPQISVSNPNGPRVDGNLGQIQIGKNTTLNANLTAPGGDPTVVVGVTTRW
jgi:hypothetical protein